MITGLSALILLAWLAYIGSRLVKRKQLPELVAFLIVGAILGPAGLKVISQTDIQRLAPITEIALAVLLFVIGERMSLRALGAARWAVITGVIQYVVCGTAVYLLSLQLGADRPMAVLLAAVAGAGAPMTVASVISSARAKGAYPNGLVATHAVADALAALAFAAAVPVAYALSGPSGEVASPLLGFAQKGIGGAILGIALGWVIARLGRQVETSSELLLFVLVHVLLAWLIADLLGLSLPLTALMMGSVAASLATPDASHRTFVAVRAIEQPLYLVFFALAGASAHLDALGELGLIGIGYIVARAVSKVVSGFVGGLIGGLPARKSLRLGVDLTPQAGVAVGLAVLAAESIPGAGNDMATVVLGSVVVFELIGPVLVSRGLLKGKEEVKPAKTPVGVDNKLPAQILVAGSHHVDAPVWVYDWCERMGAGLAVMGPGVEDGHHVRPMREQASARSIAFRWIPLGSESFVGSVVRTAEEIEADMVLILTPVEELHERSRLVLHPHERIARALKCPVVFLPYGEPDANKPRRLKMLGG